MVILTRARLTLEDYLRLPEDLRAELIEGELCMSPSPSFKHQNCVVNLTVALTTYVTQRRLGKVLCAPFDCILSDDTVLQPDVLFISTANLKNIRERLYGPPDLAVEILSPTHTERDRIVKRNLYAKYGVREFWIADTDAKTVEVLVLSGTEWKLHAVFDENDELTSPLLSELRIAVRDLFA